MSHKGYDFGIYRTRLREITDDMRVCADEIEHPWMKQQIRDATARCEAAIGELAVAEASYAVSEELPISTPTKTKAVRRDSQ